MNYEDKIKYFEKLPYCQEIVYKVIKGIAQNKFIKVAQHTASKNLHCCGPVKLSLMMGDLHVDIIELDASNVGGGDPVWYSSPAVFTNGECYQIYKQSKVIFDRRYELERKVYLAEQAVKNNKIREHILSEF